MGVLRVAPLAVLIACGENRTYPDRMAYEAPDAMALSCLPNLDGKIENRELKAALDVQVSLIVAPAGVKRTIEPNGFIDGQGHRIWDFATDYSDDRIAKISATAVTGRWFSTSFPAGQWVAPIDLGATVLGVYSDDGQNLLLHGIASSIENPIEGKTLLVYQAPIALYRYPLELGKRWVSVGESRNGVLRGLPYAGRDTYEVSVDQSGRLQLPDLTFTQTLRIATHVTVEPVAGPTVQRRQLSWMFECFGAVARATSLDNETKSDFTTTSELRRLGL
jgi:hypothetical protein